MTVGVVDPIRESALLVLCVCSLIVCMTWLSIMTGRWIVQFTRARWLLASLVACVSVLSSLMLFGDSLSPAFMTFWPLLERIEFSVIYLLAVGEADRAWASMATALALCWGGTWGLTKAVALLGGRAQRRLVMFGPLVCVLLVVVWGIPPAADENPVVLRGLLRKPLAVRCVDEEGITLIDGVMVKFDSLRFVPATHPDHALALEFARFLVGDAIEIENGRPRSLIRVWHTSVHGNLVTKMWVVDVQQWLVAAGCGEPAGPDSVLVKKRILDYFRRKEGSGLPSCRFGLWDSEGRFVCFWPDRGLVYTDWCALMEMVDDVFDSPTRLGGG